MIQLRSGTRSDLSTLSPASAGERVGRPDVIQSHWRLLLGGTALAYQLDHGWVVMSAGSVARNTLLDCVAGPKAIWPDVRPKNWFPVICAVAVMVAFHTARALEEDRSLRIWFPVICRLELA